METPKLSQLQSRQRAVAFVKEAQMRLTIRGFIGAFSLVIGFVIAANAQTESETHRIQETLRALHWERGPTLSKVGIEGTIRVPKGYVFLNAADSKKFMELNENPGSGNEYLLMPQDLHWYAIFWFQETGYVKDDEKIDADALLDSIKTNTETGNEERRKRGWSAVHVTGWQFEPSYDAATNQLQWAILAEANQGTVVNFDTRILGRRGVMHAKLVSDPNALTASVGQFKTALRNFNFVPGENYREFRQGDKLAEYGLTGLILGGATAVAAKTGLFKVLWKFIAGGFVAIAAGGVALLRRLAGKRS